MYSGKKIQVDMDTIISFVIQSGSVSEGEAISVSHYVHSLIGGVQYRGVSMKKQSFFTNFPSPPYA